MERSLASIQTVLEVKKHPNADTLDLIKVLGWQLVAKLGEFKVGDKCVYCEIDSVLPEKPAFEFLRAKKFKIKTVKLRGEISQGIAFRISDVLPEGNYEIGQNVAELIGIIKYEAPIAACLAGEVIGARPDFVPKTDEIRVQSVPEILSEFKKHKVYITTKVEGTSCSIYFLNKDKSDPDVLGKVGVCSRNMEYKLEADSGVAYVQIMKSLDISRNLADIGRNLTVQGELCGPGIQKNRLGLKELTLFVFNIFDIDSHKYLGLNEMLELCEKLKLQTVPLQCKDVDFTWNTVEELIELAKGNYPGIQHPREGIVIRPMTEQYSEILKGRLSIKVVNNDYLLKTGE